MDADDDVRTPRGLLVPAAALAWTFARSSGPGGQHVNKTASRATLSIDTAAIVGDDVVVERVRAAHGAQLRVTSQVSSSQWRNRQQCIERAVALIDEAARPPGPTRKKSKPTRGAVERRLEGKRRDSDKKASRRDTDW